MIIIIYNHMESYTHAKGSNIESTNRREITEILNLLPDNSNSEVSIKDIRDSVFSVWEGCPIKFTYANSIEYIGIFRPDTKMKMFFGKRSILKNDVMSEDLLRSDTDIFFYNTKEDNVDQDLKISLLSGKDRSIWSKAPYIQSSNIGESINLSLINDNGEILIKSSDKISLNNIKWPSIEESSKMISSPSDISDNDLGLYITDGKFLEFKKSSPNREILFTDKKPTQIDIGGIKAGSTFDNVPISEILRQILYPYLDPKAEIEILNSNHNNSLERDHTNLSTIDLKYSILRRSENIIRTVISIKNTKTIIENRECDGVVSSGPSRSEFYDKFQIDPSKISTDKSNGTFTISINMTDSSGIISEISETINFVYPYFFGFKNTINFDQESIISGLSSMNKRIDIRCNHTMLMVGEGYFYFMYPRSYGDISFDSSEKFEKSLIKNISSPDGKWGSMDYNVYISKDIISIKGIPENWKVIFQ